MKDASYAPVYCALYPELAEIARQYGYALAVHGSLQRDFDLVCIPWVEDVAPPADVVKAMTEKFTFHVVGDPTEKPHGRIAWTLSVGFGRCAVDLSFVAVGGS